MRKAALVLVAVAGSLVFGLTGASGGAEQAPGVTSKVVKIGGTFPLSGPAASYAAIARGMSAYFSYENATKRGADKARGCGGRQVKFIVYDDIFNPPQTVTQTIRLVDQDKVFATLGASAPSRSRRCVGTSTRTRCRSSTSPRARRSGAPSRRTTSGRSAGSPTTRVRARSTAGASGTTRRTRRSRSSTRTTTTARTTSRSRGRPRPQEEPDRGHARLQPHRRVRRAPAARAAGSGADTLMIFATPTHTIRTYATLRTIQWKPAQIYLNSVSATDTFMTIAVGLATPSYVNGSISVQYLKDPASPDNANDAGVNLYKQILGKYLPNARVTDGLYLYGFAKGGASATSSTRSRREAHAGLAHGEGEQLHGDERDEPVVPAGRHFDDVEERQVPDLGRAADRVREPRLEADRPAGRSASAGKEEVGGTCSSTRAGLRRPRFCSLSRMPEAVIVAAARTPIGRARKGSFVDVRPDDLAAFAIRSALDQVPELDDSEIVDVMVGCGFPQERQGMNLGRRAACSPICRPLRPARPSTGSAPRACRRSAWRSTPFGPGRATYMSPRAWSRSRR